MALEKNICCYVQSEGSFSVNTSLKSHLKISPGYVLTFFFSEPAHLLPFRLGENSSVYKF